MAIPWLTVLKAVPWSDVISNAPKVADGAKKLWKTIGRKGPAETAGIEPGKPLQFTEPQTIATLHARLLNQEANLADLHEQMLASSELIKTLAEQQALLIERAEAMRIRMARLLVLTLIVGCVAVGTLTVLLTR